MMNYLESFSLFIIKVKFFKKGFTILQCPKFYFNYEKEIPHNLLNLRPNITKVIEIIITVIIKAK